MQEGHHKRVYGLGPNGKQLLNISRNPSNPPSTADTNAIFQCQAFQEALCTQVQQVHAQHGQQITKMQEQQKVLEKK